MARLDESRDKTPTPNLTPRLGLTRGRETSQHHNERHHHDHEQDSRATKTQSSQLRHHFVALQRKTATLKTKVCGGVDRVRASLKGEVRYGEVRSVGWGGVVNGCGVEVGDGVGEGHGVGRGENVDGDGRPRDEESDVEVTTEVIVSVGAEGSGYHSLHSRSMRKAKLYEAERKYTITREEQIAKPFQTNDSAYASRSPSEPTPTPSLQEPNTAPAPNQESVPPQTHHPNRKEEDDEVSAAIEYPPSHPLYGIPLQQHSDYFNALSTYTLSPRASGAALHSETSFGSGGAVAVRRSDGDMVSAFRATLTVSQQRFADQGGEEGGIGEEGVWGCRGERGGGGFGPGVMGEVDKKEMSILKNLGRKCGWSRNLPHAVDGRQHDNERENSRLTNFHSPASILEPDCSLQDSHTPIHQPTKTKQIPRPPSTNSPNNQLLPTSYPSNTTTSTNNNPATEILLTDVLRTLTNARRFLQGIVQLGEHDTQEAMQNSEDADAVVRKSSAESSSRCGLQSCGDRGLDWGAGEDGSRGEGMGKGKGKIVVDETAVSVRGRGEEQQQQEQEQQQRPQEQQQQRRYRYNAPHPSFSTPFAYTHRPPQQPQRSFNPPHQPDAHAQFPSHHHHNFPTNLTPSHTEQSFPSTGKTQPPNHPHTPPTLQPRLPTRDKPTTPHPIRQPARTREFQHKPQYTNTRGVQSPRHERFSFSGDVIEQGHERVERGQQVWYSNHSQRRQRDTNSSLDLDLELRRERAYVCGRGARGGDSREKEEDYFARHQSVGAGNLMWRDV
ncbi:predicted protein [Plenodomus lingam JN3]|uniref:Predicted protein n=1 Tax=Leptosphaeria maculans (strain JN3 / isolate v23.1.3 / race Av1-4-5-6-7-8) TaxID=985895 RepID=E4ZSB6_LEPMJ|nr:predicted protein [Plenodomus lingam JN3]CBX94296.1 predicted protein [Plenodomus lingam JN3]